jgi:hypothetical protein
MRENHKYFEWTFGIFWIFFPLLLLLLLLYVLDPAKSGQVELG